MLLKKGSSGDDVKKLQTRLGLVPDGVFGNDTELKVKNFQFQNGLTPDGIVGDITWNRLFSSIIPNTSNINLNKLKGKVPDYVLNELPSVMEKFGINTKLRVAHFLSQCAHESGGFRVVRENLNYSAQGLISTFPKYFNQNNANQFAYQPQKIANKVYGGRLGNFEPNDGWVYCGKGYIQLTGRDNYKAFDSFTLEDTLNNPDLIATKYPLTSAGWFFYKTGLLQICDKGSTDEVVKEVTRIVNGGYNGLNERIVYFNRFWNALQ